MHQHLHGLLRRSLNQRSHQIVQQNSVNKADAALELTGDS